MAGVPPKKNTAAPLYVTVVSQANTNIFQVNPTIAAGDFQVSIDGGAFNNPATLPVVSPAGSKQIEIALSAAERNGDVITVIGSDQAGAEWADVFIELFTDTETVGGIVASLVAALLGISPINLAMRQQDLQLYRGDTWVQPITGLGDLTGYTRMYITAREDRQDTDAQSAFQVRLSDPPDAGDGLQYIAATAATTPGNASITVTGLVAGAVAVRIEAVETAKLGTTSKLRWDYQWTDGTDTETRRRGDLYDISDVTRATS